MNSHIKTTSEIMRQLQEEITLIQHQEIMAQEWVGLEWLREQIQDMKLEKEECIEDAMPAHHRIHFNKACDELLRRIEEGKKW